jgi:ribonuclease P protein component
MRVARRAASASPFRSDRTRPMRRRDDTAATRADDASSTVAGVVASDAPRPPRAEIRGQRFPHATRVVKPRDFVKLRRTGQRIGTRFFNAQAVVGEHDTARMGLAVSRRVSTRAVRRNRIKRIARESFRAARASLPPIDILLIARESANAEDNATLRADLAALWKRLATLNDGRRAGTMRA